MDIWKPGIIHVHVLVTLLVYMNRINWWNSCLTGGVLLEILLCSYCSCYRPTITSIHCEFAVWTVRGWAVLGVTGCLLPQIFVPITNIVRSKLAGTLLTLTNGLGPIYDTISIIGSSCITQPQMISLNLSLNWIKLWVCIVLHQNLLN